MVLCDPPYNISKAEWDKIDDYFAWCEKWIKQCERILKRNGSFYFWHNNIESASHIISSISQNTSFVFRNMLVWNKRFDGAKGTFNKGYMDGFLMTNSWNWQKMCEYCFYFTFGNLFSAEISRQMKDKGLKESDFRKLKVSKRGNPTGWCSNIIKGRSIPTRSDWKLICSLIGDIPYDDLAPKFNNQKQRHSIMNFEIPTRNGHVAQKPVEMLQCIIETSTNIGDTVLDCFMGSGSTGVACLNTGRDFIGIELDEKYFGIAKDRIENHQVT